MTDIAAFHVDTIRAGQFDPHQGNDKLCKVRYDTKTYYYDLSEMDVNRDEFESFVHSAWDIWLGMDGKEIDVSESDGVYSVNIT